MIDTPEFPLAENPSEAFASLRLEATPPQRILVINCGSSSLKYCFYDTQDQSRPTRGLVDRIGVSGTQLVQRSFRGEVRRDLPITGFAEAFQFMLTELCSTEAGMLQDASAVSLVVHRVVHGGETFTQATVIRDDVLARIETLNPLAPLHNPINVAGIREMQTLFPSIPQVAVFDTAFHHTLPPHAFLYGLPYECYEKQGIRRYGFHGTSHHSASLRAAEFLKRRAADLRLVSCHLGNGSSVCAVERGFSVDTSMGFTPGEGLIMGTRCGDLDSGVLAFLERTQNISAIQSDELLNRKSGLLGMSGVSSDMRDVMRAAESGHKRARQALDAYCYRVRKYVGAYVAAMGGLDAVLFTGGIGQRSSEVRARSLQGLECLGIVLDPERNHGADGIESIARIAADSSKIEVLVVPADEERMMACEGLRTLERLRGAHLGTPQATSSP